MSESKKEVIYVSSNPMKKRTVERFVKNHSDTIEIIAKEMSFFEPQSLHETTIIEYKAREAWNCFRQPVLVDDAGFYIDEFAGFPGPLAKPTVMSLGWHGIFKLAGPDFKARVYCRLGYVDENGELFHYRGETKGILDVTAPPAIVERRGVYALLQPEGCDRTIASMTGTSDIDIYSPRTRALKNFVEDNRFIEEFNKK